MAVVALAAGRFLLVVRVRDQFSVALQLLVTLSAGAITGFTSVQ
jgi:hypothetical protein